MSESKHDDLVTSEGVDEGSAASTAESASTGAVGVTGPAPSGSPAAEGDEGAPLDVETPDIAGRRPTRPGQELSAGEG